MPRNKSGSANGGVIGKTNKSSFGKNTVTSKTSSGCITAQSGTRVIDYLVIAGGGGGGAGQNCGPGCNGAGGGGGGAGGVFASVTPLAQGTINAQGTIPVTVGGGGAAGTGPSRQGSSGTASTLVGGGTTYPAVAGGGGGGGGQTGSPASPVQNGLPGGSGGGTGSQPFPASGYTRLLMDESLGTKASYLTPRFIIIELYSILSCIY